MKKLRIGFISTRLNGTDGVSLEVEKWSQVLRRLDHELFYCAGELGGYAAAGELIPALHFTHPSIQEFTRRAFDPHASVNGSSLQADIIDYANSIKIPLTGFIHHNHLDAIIVENALAIPMNLPLGVCLSSLIADLSLPAIAHHHDFYWERQRYQAGRIPDLLDSYFPPDLPTIRHVTINSIAQKRLELRRGIRSSLVPNVHDFASPPPGIDSYNRDFRQALSLRPGERFILQPTRVIERKGIELAIELVRRLDLPEPRLVITHQATDEGLAYFSWLQREARQMGVELLLVDDLVRTERSVRQGRKIYSLWDAYPHADLVTYPSLYEGFGNALLEAVYFHRLIVVNRYPVYNADIRPLGFEFVELDGFVSEEAVQKTRLLLNNPEQVQAMAEKNYRLAQEHFSLEVLEQKLLGILNTF